MVVFSESLCLPRAQEGMYPIRHGCNGEPLGGRIGDVGRVFRLFRVRFSSLVYRRVLRFVLVYQFGCSNVGIGRGDVATTHIEPTRFAEAKTGLGV